MCKHFFEFVRRGKTKKTNILLIIILVLVARLFFLTFLSDIILAKNKVFKKGITEELIDPMEKIGKGVISKKIISIEKIKDDSSENKVEKEKNKKYLNLVEGYPIEEMIPEISKKDKSVAAFLISIAKKESDWGKHSPSKNGEHCYNYWGYKGRENPTNSGYSCFESPEHAVEVVGKRIGDLIEKEINTPEKMVVWKCGSSCSWDKPENVRKWISDVSLYYEKLNS